jgi:hypothetical protein
MSGTRRTGRATTLTLFPEAFALLKEFAPGPRQYGAFVSQLLVAEQVRREARIEERRRIAQTLKEGESLVLIG